MPFGSPSIEEAVRRGGGEVSISLLDAEAVVWLDPNDPEGLRDALAGAPLARWVQLPFAGIEAFVEAEVLDDSRTWTCAKGAFAEPVAEHALALALALLRDIPSRVRASSWGEQSGVSLYDARVTILGGGGIARELLRLLAPFRVEATVVRRSPAPMENAARVLPQVQLHEALPGALITFVTLALTPTTDAIIGFRELEMIGPAGYIVNVARGRLVVGGDLHVALSTGVIAGAALDVTDPEPLDDDHPLWGDENCLITPHTANPPSMAGPALARMVESNVAHFAAGEELEGLVDVQAGY
jgi:phosphoglycerate dehydrogenase-like enzyme